MKPTALRMAAVAVGLLAVLDPALTGERPARPIVSVVTADRDVEAADAYDALERRFTVVHGPSDVASAAVLVGTTVPDELRFLRAPVFAIIPSGRRPDVRIARIDAPRSAQLNSRPRVNVHAQVTGAAGRQLHIELSMDGLGAGEAHAAVEADSGIVVVAMSAAPGPGTHVIRAIARLAGETAGDTAAFVMDVRDDRLPVLFFDARPSWTSTFVRRVIEQDARFSVAHRVLTSRGLSNTAGPAPRTLRDYESTIGFATIVVGAPDQLAEAELAGLETFMRRRGGRVVLLMEGRSNAALDRLSGASGWRGASLAAPAPITDGGDAELLRAREFFWPGRPPFGAVVHAFTIARDSTRRPIVWSVPVGAGRLTVAGAIDAWHYRGSVGDGDSSGFDQFWPSTIAGESLGALPVVDIQITPTLSAPGDKTTVRVTVRDAFLGDREQGSARLRAMLNSDRDSVPVRLWPSATPGVFTGTVVAPRNTGTYMLDVWSGATHTQAALVVDTLASRVSNDEPEVVRAFVSSRSGTAIEATDLKRLPALVSSAVEPVSRVETWHPMRSPFWIVPFALMLGVEWWWRRRHGMA